MHRSTLQRGLVLGAIAGSFILAAGPAALAAPDGPATVSPEGIALALRGPIGADIGQATLGHSPGGFVASGQNRGILGVGGVLISTAQTTTSPPGDLATAKVNDLHTGEVTSLLGKLLPGLLGATSTTGVVGASGQLDIGGSIQLGGLGGLSLGTTSLLGGLLGGRIDFGTASGQLNTLGLGDIISSTAAKSSCQWDSKARTAAQFTMSSDISSLDVLGVPVSSAELANVPPNTSLTSLTGVSLPSLLPATVILNQQEPGPAADTMTVNAVDIQLTLPLVNQPVHIDIASSTCGQPMSAPAVSPGQQNQGNPVGTVIPVTTPEPMSGIGSTCTCSQSADLGDDPQTPGAGMSGAFRAFGSLRGTF
jgi:hypothetical protein